MMTCLNRLFANVNDSEYSIVFRPVEMGIKNLYTYVRRYMSNVQRTELMQSCVGSSIYPSTIAYMDYTSKLLSMYYENKLEVLSVDEMLEVFVNGTIELLDKMLFTNDHIYVFVDRKTVGVRQEFTPWFEDILPSKEYIFNAYSQEQYDDDRSYGYIETSVYESANENLMAFGVEAYGETFRQIMIDNVRCEYEINGLRYTNPKTQPLFTAINSLTFDDINILSDVQQQAWYRYLTIHGAKALTKRKRVTTGRDNELNFDGDVVPFTLLMYLIPRFVKDIFERKPEYVGHVEFFGCGTESDFSMYKHITTYSKQLFPAVYTTDTDMVALLCDVDCIINFTMSDFTGYNSDHIRFNPVHFWKYMFECDMDARVIKLLCVLMGTDYNDHPPAEHSPIHLRWFDNILEKMRLRKFSSITFDNLLLYIHNTMNRYPDNEFIRETAWAINMFLTDNEIPLTSITGNEETFIDEFLVEFRKHFPTAVPVNVTREDVATGSLTESMKNAVKESQKEFKRVPHNGKTIDVPQAMHGRRPVIRTRWGSDRKVQPPTPRVMHK